MTPIPMDETRLRLLRSAYARLNDSAFVAFVDESYVTHANAHGSKTFYIAAAYVAPVRIHADVRADLAAIVGASYWHTTEAHAAGDSTRIHELCEYISEAGPEEGFLLAVKSPISDRAHGDEDARVECLTTLFAQLHLGSLVPRPSLTVVEERRHQGQRSRDGSTVRAIRRAGLIGDMQILFTSPAVESLLWVPDVVAFAQSHHERSTGTNYIGKLTNLLRLVSAEKRNPR